MRTEEELGLLYLVLKRLTCQIFGSLTKNKSNWRTKGYDKKEVVALKKRRQRKEDLLAGSQFSMRRA